MGHEPEMPDDFSEAQKGTPAERIDALGAIGRKRAAQAIFYYTKGTPSKRTPARALRMMALAFGLLATISPLLTPLLAKFLFKDDSIIKDLASVSALFGALAVACIGFDRLFGFSNAWMRFVTTVLDLEARLRAFDVAWTKERLRADASPTTEQTIACLDLLAAFLSGIDEVIRAETQAWVTEFRGVLADTEKSLEAQRASLSSMTVPERGALQLRMPQAASFQDGTFTVQVGGREREVRNGSSTAVFEQLAPGLVKFQVEAKLGGKDVSAEQAVLIEPGKVNVVEVQLG